MPELRQLRRAHTHIGSNALPKGGIDAAQLIRGAAGLQIEIIARFKLSPTVTTGRFGLLVLASSNKAEHTAVAFDIAREHVLLDRTHSGASIDCDLRAGPWPQAAIASASASRSVTVHIYVDHQVVEAIAFSDDAATNDNTATRLSPRAGVEAVESTAISAWVKPASGSDGVAAFSEADGVTLESLDVWQLAAPRHG